MNTKEPSTLLPSSEMARTGTAFLQNWRWSLGSADNLIYLLLTCSYVGYLSSGTINVLCVKLSVLPLATHATPLSCSFRNQEKASAAVNKKHLAGSAPVRVSARPPDRSNHAAGADGTTNTTGQLTQPRGNIPYPQNNRISDVTFLNYGEHMTTGSSSTHQ